MGIMKKGRVVILLAGRLSGKKSIIIKQNDEGKKNRKFPHALVCGVERCPRKVTKKMSKKKVERKSTIKPFVKEDFDFKNILTDETMEDPEQRKDAKKQLKAKLQDRYNHPEGPGEKQQMADFIFTKLRF